MATGALTAALLETLSVFEEEPDGTPLTTSEVAERLDMGRRSTYDRLDRLTERDRLETKQVGARGRIWWLPPDDPSLEQHQRTDPDPEQETAGGDRSTDADEGSGDEAGETDLETATTRTESAGELTETTKSFSALVEAVEEYAIFHLDPDGVVTTWNPGAERIKGYASGEIVGESFEAFYTESDVADGVPEQNLEAAAREGWIEDEGWRVRQDGTRFWASVTITALYGDDGELAGYAKVTKDMTERRTFEERLRRQRDELESELDEVFERIDDAFLALDEELVVTYINDRATELLDHDVSDALGASIWEAFPSLDAPEPRDRIEEAVDSQESVQFDVHISDRDRWLESRFYPSDTGLSVYVRDVTERKERQRELERYETIVEAVDDGIYVVEDGRFTMVNDRYVEMTGYSRAELLGAPVSLVVDEETATGAAQHERALLEGERDTVRVEADVERADGETFRAEATFTLLPGCRGAGDAPDGSERTDADRGDAENVERACVVRNVTERVERERELERRRERLAALDDLNAVVREVTSDVIEQSTREEIERTLCERLAAADSYEFAWIGDVDAATKTVRQRVGAGTDDAPEELAVPIGDDEPTGDGPIARAVETHEMQVAADLTEDPAYDAWQGPDSATAGDGTRDHDADAQPVAAIPIVHEGNCYGILNLSATRDRAFADEEREVVAQLGTVVGNAIAAIERKRALMSDELVELEFRVSGVVSSFDVDVPDVGDLTLDRAISIGDGEYLVYGTADDDGVELVRSIVRTLPHWESVDTFDGAPGERRLQIRLSEPPVLDAVASRGGSVEELTIEDGEAYMRINLVPGADVREVLDVVDDTYPDAEMLSRRQITRGDVEASTIDRREAMGRLTERQRVALEAAYNMGFFERPRVHSGEEIAETLDVAAATFHQHLRKAEQELIGAVVDGALE